MAHTGLDALSHANFLDHFGACLRKSSFRAAMASGLSSADTTPAGKNPRKRTARSSVDAQPLKRPARSAGNEAPPRLDSERERRSHGCLNSALPGSSVSAALSSLTASDISRQSSQNSTSPQFPGEALGRSNLADVEEQRQCFSVSSTESAPTTVTKVPSIETATPLRKLSEEAKAKIAEEVTRIRARAEKEARVKAEVQVTVAAVEEARLNAEEDAKTEAEKCACAQAEEDAKVHAVQMVFLGVEEEARSIAEAKEGIKAKAEREARSSAEYAIRLKTEEDTKTAAEQIARAQTEEVAKKQAEQMARLRADEESQVKARAENEVRAQAVEDAKSTVREGARFQAEESAKQAAETITRAKTEEDAKVQAKQLARLRAEEEIATKSRAEQKACAMAEEEAKRTTGVVFSNSSARSGSIVIEESDAQRFAGREDPKGEGIPAIARAPEAKRKANAAGKDKAASIASDDDASEVSDSQILAACAAIESRGGPTPAGGPMPPSGPMPPGGHPCGTMPPGMPMSPGGPLSPGDPMPPGGAMPPSGTMPPCGSMPANGPLSLSGTTPAGHLARIASAARVARETRNSLRAYLAALTTTHLGDTGDETHAAAGAVQQCSKRNAARLQAMRNLKELQAQTASLSALGHDITMTHRSTRTPARQPLVPLVPMVASSFVRIDGVENVNKIGATGQDLAPRLRLELCADGSSRACNVHAGGHPSLISGGTDDVRVVPRQRYSSAYAKVLAVTIVEEEKYIAEQEGGDEQAVNGVHAQSGQTGRRTTTASRLEGCEGDGVHPRSPGFVPGRVAVVLDSGSVEVWERDLFSWHHVATGNAVKLIPNGSEFQPFAIAADASWSSSPWPGMRTLLWIVLELESASPTPVVLLFALTDETTPMGPGAITTGISTHERTVCALRHVASFCTSSVAFKAPAPATSMETKPPRQVLRGLVPLPCKTFGKACRDDGEHCRCYVDGSSVGAAFASAECVPVAKTMVRSLVVRRHSSASEASNVSLEELSVFSITQCFRQPWFNDGPTAKQLGKGFEEPRSFESMWAFPSSSFSSCRASTPDTWRIAVWLSNNGRGGELQLLNVSGECLAVLQLGAQCCGFVIPPARRCDAYSAPCAWLSTLTPLPFVVALLLMPDRSSTGTYDGGQGGEANAEAEWILAVVSAHQEGEQSSNFTARGASGHIATPCLPNMKLPCATSDHPISLQLRRLPPIGGCSYNALNVTMTSPVQPPFRDLVTSEVPGTRHRTLAVSEHFFGCGFERIETARRLSLTSDSGKSLVGDLHYYVLDWQHLRLHTLPRGWEPLAVGHQTVIVRVITSNEADTREACWEELIFLEP